MHSSSKPKWPAECWHYWIYMLITLCILEGCKYWRFYVRLLSCSISNMGVWWHIQTFGLEKHSWFFEAMQFAILLFTLDFCLIASTIISKVNSDTISENTRKNIIYQGSWISTSFSHIRCTLTFSNQPTLTYTYSNLFVLHIYDFRCNFYL